ncbi:hypothetical protein [Streptomyces chartreusis]|uniref:NACHT domain-containing protein n=1 Tax=Streptomyces chartreusis TaxID=1969 RepID=UPI002E80F492|nr:hypothetical protein [Streptomyces chartreusis]WUB23236.1 hypothetical protein OG997_44015 [Streptomyces chartreusis]
MYALWQIARGGLEPADLAGVLGLPLGLAGLAAAIWALRRPVEGGDAEQAAVAARTLARQVAGSEGVVRRQLLGDDALRINLLYQLHRSPGRTAQAPHSGRVFADGSVSLPDITAFYEATRPARLVITGAAGAGKTVLALELMLVLIKKRGEQDPVPVRVPLAEWDPSIPLRVLLVERLVRDYGWHHGLAAAIVDTGLVLPVLDGLDEMDPTRPDGTPDPDAPRARAALDQLNRYQDTDGLHPAPLVMTCRSTHYDALPQTGILIDAARITITPVDPGSAAAYLAARARDPLRWQSLLHHLRAYPTSPHALALSTPWRLCLTATAYQDAGNPDELLGFSTRAGLDRHLLSRYIPAATRISAREHRYTPRRVHRWLHVLASHLATSTSDGTDLLLARLWPLAGSARVRRTDALFTTLACLLPLPLAWLTPAPLPVAGAVAAIAVLTGRSVLRSTFVQLGAIGLKGVRTLRGLIGFSSRLAVGALAGLAVGLAASVGGRLSLLGLAGAAVAVVAIVPAIVVSDVLEDVSPEAALPRTALREDIVFSLLGGLAVALGAGTGLGLGFGRAIGGVLGLAAGLAVGLSTSGARRYLVFLTCARTYLPFRLARFLDWACTNGLMRYSGPVYQFRHRELQQWLAARPSPITRQQQT